MSRKVMRVSLDFDWPLHKTWKGYLTKPIREPPRGLGWQMWETTSEGSPISPVFKTPEELAQWLADNKASAFGHLTATYDQWLAMIKRGWAPSALMVDHEVLSGVEAGA